MRATGLVGLLALGCSHSALMSGSDDLSFPAGADLSRAADLRLGGGQDLAGFCGDPNSARADFNGIIAASPAVMATFLPLNCCEAGELLFVSQQLPQLLAVDWRHQVGQGPSPPTMLDLANLPMGWDVLLYVGCSPMTQPGCVPSDSYSTGFSGSLSVSVTATGYQASLCLTVDEPAGMPHTVLHSARLWTPPITTQ
jgi:hypothetical protein